MQLDAIKEKINTGINSSEQYVTFLIKNETYGIEVLRVKEIVGITSIRSIPNSASYLKGVINLRGKVVPVIDLRVKFNIPEKEYDTSTVILIIEDRGNLVGIIVDAVSDVIDMPGELQDISELHTSINREVIKGVLNMESNLIMVLNPDIMLSTEDIQAVSEAEKE